LCYRTVENERPRGSPSAGSLLEEIVVPRLERREITIVLSDSTAAAGGVAGGRLWDQELPELPSQLLSPRHAHEVGIYEICWVLSGRCVLVVGAHALGIETGDACVIRPGEVHQLRPTPSLEPFDTLWWHVRPNGISLSLDGFTVDRYSVRGGFVPLATPPAPVLARVVKELEAARPRSDLLVRAILLELAATLLRQLDEVAAGLSPPPMGRRRSNLHVQHMAQYIETHYGGGVTLESLARVAGLSPYYLTRLFRRYTSRSVMTYLTDVRHREAQALLRDTDLSIAEVARHVGYEDPYYFSRVFKAREGRAPLHFRLQTRAEPNAEPSAEHTPEPPQ